MFGKLIELYMFKNLYELSQYAKDNGKLYVLELPLELKAGNLEYLLRNRFEEYKSLLISFLDSNGGQDVIQKYVPYLERLQESILILLKYRLIKFPFFKETLDDIDKKFNLFDKVTLYINQNQNLYRLCSYADNLKETKDFYHCPITLKEKNKPSRFGTKDDLLWYLGFTRKVCIECEARDKTACMAQFHIKPNESLKVLDLTQGNIFSKKNSKIDGLCYLFWWLIACCYCGFDKYDNDHNTYIIPQMFSKYIKENYPKIDGIKYYTVRNAQLDPNEKTYVNVAFFTRNYNEEGYDMDLCRKFEMISSEQNIIIQH